MHLIAEQGGTLKCKKVAVVILNYNGLKFLKDFLPSYQKDQYPDHDLVYVDNASTDGSLEYVKVNYPHIKTVSIAVNKGFTNGYAMSLPLIDSKYYVLINSDVEVTENWIAPVIEKMEEDGSIGAAQPKIKAQTSRQFFEYSGASGGFIDKFGYPFCRGRIFHHLEEDSGQYDRPMECFWATGACMFIRAELYHKLGGLDNDFYAHMEEIDLCWRIKNAGYKVIVVPASTIYHVGGSIISYGSYNKLYRNFRNNLILIFKNMKSSELIWKFPFRLGLDYVAAFRGLITGNRVETKAILNAHMDFFRELSLWRKKRRQAKKQVFNRNTRGIYQRSIVWDFFIRKRKNFIELDQKLF